MNENNGLNKSVINWYPGHMAKTKREIKEKINLIDVVYELVDSRIPFSSKIKDITEYTKNKPRLLIMTKKDLCDLKVTQKWVKYYEKEGYNVVLADLQNKQDIKEIIKKTNNIAQEINAKRMDKGLKDKDIKVLVVGIPNVGKSTLINSLVGKKVALAANKPGVTKNVVWLKTNLGLSLLDTPGILWPKLDEKNSYALASMLAIKQDILDLTEVGMYILNFLKINYPNILKDKYKLANLDEDTLELAYELGLKMGFVKKDEVDYDKVFLRIYNDLASEKIKGVTLDNDI